MPNSGPLFTAVWCRCQCCQRALFLQLEEGPEGRGSPSGWPWSARWFHSFPAAKKKKVTTAGRDLPILPPRQSPQSSANANAVAPESELPLSHVSLDNNKSGLSLSTLAKPHSQPRPTSKHVMDQASRRHRHWNWSMDRGRRVMCREYCWVLIYVPFFVDISTEDQDLMFLAVRQGKIKRRDQKGRDAKPEEDGGLGGSNSICCSSRAATCRQGTMCKKGSRQYQSSMASDQAKALLLHDQRYSSRSGHGPRWVAESSSNG